MVTMLGWGGSGRSPLLEARTRKGDSVRATDIAAFYDAAGLPDKTLEWLEKGVAQRDPNVLGADLMTSLRPPGGEEDPRLLALRRRIGLS